MYYLIIETSKNMTVIAITAYLLSKTNIFKKTLVNTHSIKDTALLASFFGLLSILGNHLGIPIMGSLANSRIIGPVLGGLLGGPVVGVVAGIIGAIHRYTFGGFTMQAAALSNIIAGIIGGLFYKRFGPQSLTLKHGFFACLLSEIVLKSLVLLISKPFSEALALEKVIAIPTIIINCLGVTIFLLMVKDLYNEKENSAALAAEKSLKIATLTVPILKNGLNLETAQATSEVVKEVTGAPAVAITDHEKIISFIGEGTDHHKPGSNILTKATKKAIHTKKIVLSQTKELIGCPNPDCPLTAVIDAPLIVKNKVIATLKIYKINGNQITPTDIKIIEGTAKLLSIQLELAESEKKAKLLANAEYNALKAQINPHFLFNTLSTIMYLCRTDPNLARQTLKQLADFFRKTLQSTKDLTSINEELETVRAYISIEKLRFADRLTIIEEIDHSTLNQLIPVFTIQPLVENALKHGLFPKSEKGNLVIKVANNYDNIEITIKDDGVGIPPDILQLINEEISPTNLGIGLSNVNKRLQSFYGPEHGLNIKSEVKIGTEIKIAIPS